MLRKCPRCGECKLVAEFGKNKARRDGLNVYCRPCVREKSLAYAVANREKVRLTKAASVRRHAAKRQAWLASVSERMKAYWREYGRRWRAENRGASMEKVRRQQAARQRAVPPWFDREKAAAIYAEAAARRAAGENVHVDHEVPINGRNVCGLHWHMNLRVIPAAENIKKGRSFPSE